MNPFDSFISGTPVHEYNDVDTIRHNVRVFAGIGHPFTPNNIIRYTTKLSPTSDMTDIIQEVAARNAFYPDTIVCQCLGLDIVMTPLISIGVNVYPTDDNGYAAFVSGCTQYAFTNSHDGSHRIVTPRRMKRNVMFDWAVNDGFLEDKGIFLCLSDSFRQLYINQMGGKYEPI